MTHLSAHQVNHIAKLAQLTLTEDEVTKFQGQLSSILEYVNKLQEVDTSGVEETSQVTGLENVWREDMSSEDRMLSQDAALSNAKVKHNGYVVVPAVIEKE